MKEQDNSFLVNIINIQWKEEYDGEVFPTTENEYHVSVSLLNEKDWRKKLKKEVKQVLTEIYGVEVIDCTIEFY